jgi:hypothetical protein
MSQVPWCAVPPCLRGAAVSGRTHIDIKLHRRHNRLAVVNHLNELKKFNSYIIPDFILSVMMITLRMSSSRAVKLLLLVRDVAVFILKMSPGSLHLAAS